MNGWYYTLKSREHFWISAKNKNKWWKYKLKITTFWKCITSENKKLSILLSKLYSIILLINIYVNIPNSFNILSKAARLLFKKLIHILKSYCDWADLSTLLFDLLCTLRFLYKMYFRWKVLKFTSITKTFH